MRPSISVCIATYNGEKYIREQLESILMQLSSHDEIVVSDDSSNDKTLDVIRSLNDARIKIYPNQKFRSPVLNFENALILAQNEIIFLADQDDVWVEGKVLAMLESLSEYDMAVCDHSLIDENNQVLLKSYFSEISSGPGVLKNLKKNTYYGCCMAFKRHLLRIALPFPTEIPMHDIWLGVVTDMFFRAKFINYPYTLYRKHSANASSATELKSKNSLFKKIRFRVAVIRYLPLLLFRKLKYNK